MLIICFGLTHCGLKKNVRLFKSKFSNDLCGKYPMFTHSNLCEMFSVILWISQNWFRQCPNRSQSLAWTDDGQVLIIISSGKGLTPIWTLPWSSVTPYLGHNALNYGIIFPALWYGKQSDNQRCPSQLMCICVCRLRVNTCTQCCLNMFDWANTIWCCSVMYEDSFAQNYQEFPEKYQWSNLPKNTLIRLYFIRLVQRDVLLTHLRQWDLAHQIFTLIIFQ